MLYKSLLSCVFEKNFEEFFRYNGVITIYIVILDRNFIIAKYCIYTIFNISFCIHSNDLISLLVVMPGVLWKIILLTFD